MNDGYELKSVVKEGIFTIKEVSIKLCVDSSWTDICESFVAYLQACGFSVDGADVMDCFDEMYGDFKEAKNDTI